MRPFPEEDRRGATWRPHARAALAVGLLVAASSACILPSPSYDEYDDGSAGSSSSASAQTSESAASEPSTSSSSGDELTTSGTGSTTGAGSTSTSSTSTGEPTTGGDDTYPVHSCAELQAYLLENDRAVLSGVYTIHLPNSETAVEVYCDLELAGGGWLLAGRSVAFKDSDSFGWRSGTGALADDALPYSLNLQQNPFPFDQILIGTWSEGKEWGENVYRYGVPADLITHEDDLVPTTFIEAVKGDCAPVTGPAMLDYIGATAKTRAFFLRDTTEIDGANYGLLHDMLWTYYTDDCPLGGMLAQQQGMLMVR